MKSKESISIVLPVYNEEKGLKEFHSQLIDAIDKDTVYNYELIYVNDGSTDQSLETLYSLKNATKSMRYSLKIINFSRNFGHQNAIFCGIEKSTGDAVITMDTDLQDPPIVITKLIEQWKLGSDIVLAKRIERRGESHFKKISSRIYYQLINRLSDTPLNLDVGDFRLLNRKAVKALLTSSDSELYLRGTVSWIGFKKSEVEYTRDPRFAGSTSYSLKKMLDLGIAGISNFSVKPLKLATLMSVIASFSAIAIAIYLIIGKILNPNASITGFTSLSVMILGAFAIQMLCLGILGEYLAISLSQSRNRPRYIVNNEHENLNE